MNWPDPEIDPMEMLHRASTEETVPEETRARVWTAVTGALQAGAAKVAATSSEAAPAEADHPRDTAGTAPASIASGRGALRPWVAKLLYWSAPAFVMGAAAGVTAGRAIAPAVSPPVHAATPTFAPKPSPSLLGSAPEPDFEIVPSAAAEPSAAAPAAESPSGAKLGSAARELARERAILDQARAQIAAGEPARALDYVERHGRRHPQGTLSEEREALAVNALVGLGRYREALQRGEAFRSRYPNSLLMPSVEAALLAIPER